MKCVTVLFLENGGTLKPVPNYCKHQEMCNTVVDNYLHVFELTPECCKTQKCVIKQLRDVFCIWFCSQSI